MARPSPDPELLPVTWRDGIHIRGTPIWCDALRARDVCFVSCAHALPSSRHGQLIATAETLTMLGDSPGSTRLPVPYGRPFSLGTARLELVRSGHALGSASLLIEQGGYRVLYASAVNPHGGGLGGVADTRPCDAVVAAADYGAARFRFPPVGEVVDRVADFVLEVTTAGGAAILLVTSPGKALDVASRLADRLAMPTAGRRVSFFGHRHIYDVAVRVRRELPALPRIRRHTGRPPPGHVLLWPVSRRAALPAEVSGESRVALISGAALDPGATRELAVAAAYPWSNQADRDELVGYIETCGARRVFLTHRHADALASELRAAGRSAHSLGPPRQMSLF